MDYRHKPPSGRVNLILGADRRSYSVPIDEPHIREQSGSGSLLVQADGAFGAQGIEGAQRTSG